ncbi:hypothetical protein Tco_1044305 [Tanacetum coccineum]|uniref:Uncharacterized protein n=1 Tax=Tanacetum coccineum TaxID=301880 RepID=A0ABQ5GQP9_9ASTR
MAAFWVVNNQFQKFINSKFTLDYDSQMTETYFVEYTGLEVQHFRDTLLQHLGNVKKSVAERTRHQRQYERWNALGQISTFCQDLIAAGLRARKDPERDRKSTTSCTSSAEIQTTTDDSKPNPRSNNQTSRSLPYKSFGHRFSPKKTSTVYEKTSPRSDLRWKPTGRIFKSVGLRWIPTGKLFDSCTSKVDSEPPHGSKYTSSIL